MGSTHRPKTCTNSFSWVLKRIGCSKAASHSSLVVGAKEERPHQLCYLKGLPRSSWSPMQWKCAELLLRSRTPSKQLAIWPSGAYGFKRVLAKRSGEIADKSGVVVVRFVAEWSTTISSELWLELRRCVSEIGYWVDLRLLKGVLWNHPDILFQWKPEKWYFCRRCFWWICRSSVIRLHPPCFRSTGSISYCYITTACTTHRRWKSFEPRKMTGLPMNQGLP